MPPHYHRVIVPVNGTAGDDHAIELAAKLMHGSSAGLTLVYVVVVQQSMRLDAELPMEVERGEAALARAERIARDRVDGRANPVSTDLLQARSAGAAIVDEALEQRADVIVMSAANQRLHGRTSAGETAAYVVRNAPCEVVMLRLSTQQANGSTN